MNEAEKGSLHFLLRKGCDEITKLSLQVELLARNEWGGIAHFPELAAAFVQPNDPTVQQILRKTIDILKTHGKEPSTVGYGRGKKGAWEQMSALWNAVCGLGIGYVLPPASFEQTGQKVRPPSQVIQAGVGTCLDLTMLFASCIEQCGLNPVLVFTQGHSFLGCWLSDETFSTAVVDDITALRKRLHLQELILFESTLATQSKGLPPSFKWAREYGEGHLSGEKEGLFHLAVDVRRARIQRILPLALAEGAGPERLSRKVCEEISQPQLEEAPDFALDATAFEERASKGTLTRLERWQRRLLDLSARNNLLNFRATKRVVELIAPAPALLEDRLAEGHRLRVLPSIEQYDVDPREYSLHKNRHQEDLILSHARDALDRNQVLSPLPGNELDTRLLELYRAARNSLDEGGANTLFMGMGFLSWKPVEREKPCRAPLVLIPVKLERRSVQSGFYLSLHDDEPRFNLTLIEMLRKDFEISGLDAIENDLLKGARGLDIERIWRTVEIAIKDIPGWEVSRTVVIALFSFAKYLMWKDLVDRTETLKESPVVRHLLDTPSRTYKDGVAFLAPGELDSSLPPQNVFCPLPVDSSQLAAVATAARGKDFVLVGPPGTGKSQTIANTIAQCLAEGKTVLFVAEKTAALNVVYRRLKEIGLGEFCLELHSNKSSKLEVLKQLRNSYEANEDIGENHWDLESQNLGELKDKLNEYVQTIHRPFSNGLTAYYAVGTVVSRTDITSVRLCWPSATAHDRSDLAKLREVVSNLRIHGHTAGNLESTALKEIRRREWSPTWATMLVDSADELQSLCGQLADTVKAITQITNIPAIRSDSKGLGGMERLAGSLPRAAGRDWRFLLRPDAVAIVARLREGRQMLREYKEYSNALSVPYRGEALQLDHDNLKSVCLLSRQAWIQKLQQTIDLLKEYGDLGSSLSADYTLQAHDLDHTILMSTWEQSEKSWWMRRRVLRRRVRKALGTVTADKGDYKLDCQSELAILIKMSTIRDRLSSVNPLEEEARMLWQESPKLAHGKCAAFRDALLEVASSLPIAPCAPVDPGKALGALLGISDFPALPAGKPPAKENDHTDIAALLQDRVGRLLLEHAEKEPNPARDCVKDLTTLAGMRSVHEKLKSLDDLRERTDGFWRGIGTDIDEIESATSFFEELQSAIAHFVDNPDTHMGLQKALEYLLGPGNILLAPNGGANTAFAAFIETLERFGSKRAATRRLAENSDWLDTDIPSITAACREISEQHPDLFDWCAWLRVKQEAFSRGLGPLVESVISGAVEPDVVSQTFEVNYCRWWLIAAAEELPLLRSFVAVQHEQTITDFQALDETLRTLSRKIIRMRLRSGALDDDKETKDEWGVLRKEMQKKSKHLPLRKLVSAVPRILTRLTPCILMSPLSVAQYLAPGVSRFDLVIFDEASQIPVWDAIGAMARGKHVVVSGDPKQLPPTNFFTRSEDETADDDSAQDCDMESVLDECLSSGIPPLQLRWHYRSRHESLITFSNHRYYDGKLLTFPAPHAQDRAVSYTYVAGTYQRGNTRTNPVEARALVAEIVSRLSDPQFSEKGLSIGVVTFNAEQQKLIEDLLENECRKDRSLEGYFDAGSGENLFVKNLENVQGDERDIIYFSTTYGPDSTGRVLMNFGPLNKAGGERRLNVAVTRARHELRVFSSMKPDQIDLTRTNAPGVRDLRLYLEFAQRGARAFMEEIHGSVGHFESPFEEAVASTLRQKGWTVHPQIGVSTFRIDLGVVDPDVPGRYLAGIECDGANYRRAATAKDRDKLRESVLRGLGWEILRVWSTEWWTSRERATNRLHDRLTGLLNNAREKRAQEPNIDIPATGPSIVNYSTGHARIAGAPELGHYTTSGEMKIFPELEVNEETQSLPVDFETAPDDIADEKAPNHEGSLPRQLGAFEQIDKEKILQSIVSIIEAESPIHQDVLAHQVAKRLGFFKAGASIRSSVWSTAKARFRTTEEEVGLFFWKTDAEAEHCSSCRPGRDGNPRYVNQVAMPELIALARSIIKESSGDTHLPVGIILMARHLGLKRLRNISRPRLEAAWEKASLEQVQKT
ncbi:MAG: DUF3320 domain-containing protein [Syntrophobacteraceae bacterium]|nr:DUF3320 domain-containing protein [Syntrophobacteraceae bacterium]